MKTDSVFSAHPHLTSYHKTADGMKFFKASDAHNHARTLKNRSVTEVKKTDVETVEAPKDKKPKDKKSNKKKSEKTTEASDDLTPMAKAKLRIDAIGALETIEAVKESLKDETAKTVIAAGEARIAELETPKSDVVKTSEDQE